MFKQEKRNTSSVKMSDFKKKDLSYMRFSYFNPENAKQNSFLGSFN